MTVSLCYSTFLPPYGLHEPIPLFFLQLFDWRPLSWMSKNYAFIIIYQKPQNLWHTVTYPIVLRIARLDWKPNMSSNDRTMSPDLPSLIYILCTRLMLWWRLISVPSIKIDICYEWKVLALASASSYRNIARRQTWRAVCIYFLFVVHIWKAGGMYAENGLWQM